MQKRHLPCFITNLPKKNVSVNVGNMRTIYGKTFLRLVQDPGFLLAVANALLFSRNSLLSFFVIIIALIAIVALKSYACASVPQSPCLQLLHRIGQKSFFHFTIFQLLAHRALGKFLVGNVFLFCFYFAYDKNQHT